MKFLKKMWDYVLGKIGFSEKETKKNETETQPVVTVENVTVDIPPVVETTSPSEEYIADGKTNIADAQLITDLSPAPMAVEREEKVETVKDIKSKSRNPKKPNSEVKVKKPEQKKPEQKKTSPQKDSQKSERPKQSPKPKKKPDTNK